MLRVLTPFVGLLLLLVPETSLAATAAGTAAPETISAAPARLWLSGPFGRVEGGAVFEPATVAPADEPLDAYVKRAPLVLDAGEQPIPTRSLSVIATSSATGETETLSTGPVAFEGPSEAGSSVIVASVALAGGRTVRGAWLVDVPDREPPADGLYDIPAPEVIVEGRDGSAAGAPGNGCYLYLCVEVGRTPPPALLPVLEAEPGEVLAARLSDASAIVAWDGVLRPLGDPRGPGRAASGVLTDEFVARVSLPGLEPPSRGEWILTLRVVFDRDRGSMESRYLVRAR